MLNWYLFGSLKITSTHTFAFCVGGGYLISEFVARSHLKSRTPNEAGFLYGVIQIKLLAFEVFHQWLNIATK